MTDCPTWVSSVPLLSTPQITFNQHPNCQLRDPGATEVTGAEFLAKEQSARPGVPVTHKAAVVRTCLVYPWSHRQGYEIYIYILCLSTEGK